MSGKLSEKRGKRLYFLRRWPSQRAMRSKRQKVRELTGRKWNWVKDVRVLIEEIYPILRGWGAYFRTGNASTQFVEIDSYVWWRLKRFLKKRRGRHLRAGEASAWTRAFFFENHRLFRLHGTTRCPETA